MNAVENGSAWNKPEHQPDTVLVWRQSEQVVIGIWAVGRAGRWNACPKERVSLIICEVITGCAEGLYPVALMGRLLARWPSDGVI